jgi:hypothetical protein
MRKSKLCPKCAHDKILLIAQVPDVNESDNIRPARIATMVTGKKTFMGDARTAPAGALSAAVCRACGFTELYVEDVAALVPDGTWIREA